jgi:hypothetical protein
MAVWLNDELVLAPTRPDYAIRIWIRFVHTT